MCSACFTLNTMTEVSLSKTLNLQLLPGCGSISWPMLQVCVHGVCVHCCVCAREWVNAEHEFQVWVTILVCMSRHFHFCKRLQILWRWRGCDEKKVNKYSSIATTHLLAITQSNLTSISHLALEIVFQIIIISSSVWDGPPVPSEGVSPDLPRTSITPTILLPLLTVSHGRITSLYYETVSDGRAH